MAGYELKIKSAEELIELSTKDKEGKPEIRGIRFKMNTLDDNTKNRADSVRGEMLIIGNITPESKEKTKRLAKWSLDSDRKTLYRDVVLVVYDGVDCSGVVLRRYEINAMFVIDYEEAFGESADESSDSGTFTLFIAQKEGSGRKEVFSS